MPVRNVTRSAQARLRPSEPPVSFKEEQQSDTMNQVDSVQQQRTGSVCLEEKVQKKRPHQPQDVVLKQTAVLPADVQKVLVIKEEVPYEWSSSLDQQNSEPLHITEEQEKLWTSQEDSYISRFPFIAVPVKNEDDEEEPQSSQLHQSQSKDNREETSSSTKQMKTETNREDCGGPEADPNNNLQPNTDGKSSDWTEIEVSIDGYAEEDVEEDEDEWQEPLSDSGPETESRDNDWRETRTPESAVNSDVRCSPQKKPFSCSECDKQFVYKQSLQRHMACHTEKMFSSSLGNEQYFGVKQNVDSQMRVLQREKLFGCNECNKRFRYHCELKLHMTEHTGEKPFGCSECGRRFIEQGSLKKHMTIHTGEKRFGCDVCGKRFSQQGTLKTHMTVHTGEKPFSCYVCGKRFSRQWDLKAHMSAHMEEKPFSCDDCGKRFLDQKNLKRHVTVHTGEKPFGCNTCGKRFRFPHDLLVHTRVHTGEKPFVCGDCGETFSQQGTLLRHMTVHSGERPFSCDDCGKTFTRKAHLKRHMAVHTG
uniref:Zinc finger protein OZF-like n=1 Tax=Acanthochromis polyacanthus TaxID=80966 RepID=A0A3Q1GUM3_9TELE